MDMLLVGNGRYPIELVEFGLSIAGFPKLSIDFCMLSGHLQMLWIPSQFPMALAEKSGLQPIETLSAVKSPQIKVTLSSYNLTNCNDVGTNDMRDQNISKTLVGKQHQMLLATQVKMILKIDDVISPSKY
ncbi:T-complex protein 1 subunit epsilon [Capsicum chinense]|nr:T-complex protein 1 subunit epsilon [Capsicum chinense]